MEQNSKIENKHIKEKLERLIFLIEENDYSNNVDFVFSFMDTEEGLTHIGGGGNVNALYLSTKLHEHVKKDLKIT